MAHVCLPISPAFKDFIRWSLESCASTHHLSRNSQIANITNPINNSFNHFNPSPPQFLPGPVNQDLVAPSVSSLPASPATIPRFDFTVFTTDYQSEWSSTLSSQAPLATHPQLSFNQDFQLFDTPATPISRPVVSPAQATSRTLLSRNNQVQPRRHLAPAVSQAQLNLAITTSPHTSSNNYRSYSSPALQLQHNQHQQHRQRVAQQLRRQRPPVPLFHESSATTDYISPTSAPRRRVQSTPNLPDPAMDSAFDNIYLGPNPQADFPDFGEPMPTNDFDLSFGPNPTTVSPHDLWNDENGIMSAPPSTAFPNLSTPGSEYLQSPGLSSGLNTTPLDDGLLDDTLDYSELDDLPPLFGNDGCGQFSEADASPAIATHNSFDSLPDMHSAQPSPMVRQKSSPGRPPLSAASHLRKHSLTNGINKNSIKPRKPLPEISIESDDDKDVAKRKKNTAAARKSRQRKQEVMDAHASEIARLRRMIISLGGNPDAN